MPARESMLRFVALAAPLLLPSALAAADEPPVNLGRIEITGTRTPNPVFDTPTAISVITGSDISAGPPSFNLAQSLARVPGLVAQNRLSYAQDLQISSRGFGARASFGVRGIRLLIDGIPASTPAGQGHTDIFDLAIAERIEVLRGPFSTLYGNASGGVIQVFTKDGPPQPTLTAEVMAGSYGTRVERLEAGGTAGKLNYILDVSHFETDGYREHSAAARDHARGKLTYDLGEDSSLTLLLNAENQPYALDPSGLNKEQVEADPRQAVDRVAQFGAGESHYHRQGGVVWRQQIDDNDRLYVMGWLGSRRVLQFLPFRGDEPLSGGAVIDLHNRAGGGDVHWTHEGVVASYTYTITGGADYQRLHEERKGFVNDNGEKGALRRDEDDVSSQTGIYLQGDVQLDPWRLFAGVRHTRVAFDSDDHYINAKNPDDSGSQRFSRTTPVVGVLYAVNPSLNLYANYGVGFQTPTFSELAYTPERRAGLNLDLDPSTSHNYEIGFKAQPGERARLTLALFDIETDDEIVVAQSVNGRTSYRNAGSTRRTGAELTFAAPLGGGFETYLAYSYLHATFTGARLDGNSLPGVPRQTIFGELSWQYQPLDFEAAVDAQWRDEVYVDAANSEAAASYLVVNLRAGFHQRAGDWRLQEYVRLNNIFDRDYIGAVIVGSGNGRYYEPAPGRNVLVGMSVSYVF
ncbi:MAG TPA: TonB-dependent receptor [Gammaproteobacteria bacterium]|nr:TonB-dependent receptor [Gammaproteobacteria bacterium]